MMAPTPLASSQGGMFHTFQGVTPRKACTDSRESTKSSSNVASSKRVTTPHACAECKRRKIRCDGQQPCGQCLSSRAPKRCFYDKHRQRVIPSRKTLEALSQSLEECRSILQRLYPHHEVQALLPLSRHELLGLLDRPPVLDGPAMGLPSPPSNTLSELDACLRMAPKDVGRDVEWHEEGCGRNTVDHVKMDSDHHTDRQASYLGASSIQAALMVMVKMHAGLRDRLAAPWCNVEAPPSPAARQQPQKLAWSWEGQTLIDAYFKRVHAFIPLLDEATFRADYLEGQRSDDAWVALVNMVFAMGSIVAMKSDDCSHVKYYEKAMSHLPMSCFGSHQLETVQALALVGGLYLHFVNRPATANAVMGAAMRMASTMGLHRESRTPGDNNEARRRTWWSLFCLDTWATTTLGSLGRWAPAVNVRPPELDGPDRDATQHADKLALTENVKFCKMATHIQDALATRPLLGADERRQLDAQLTAWYDGLPWLLRTTGACAEPLYLARCVMKWRYQNLRMLLHRPVLLSLASSGLNPHTQACDADLAAIDMCRELAAQTIADVAREWTHNQMSGWNAVWFLYQAAMVPLVSVFWQWGSQHVPEWLRQVEAVLELLEAMHEWSTAARQSREVVLRMYEAARDVQAERHGPVSPVSAAVAAAAAAATQRQRSDSIVSSIHVMTASDAIKMSPSDDVHMSPIGLESADNLMAMLDQHALWDVDTMYWDAGGEPDFSATPFEDAAAMTPIDYGLLGAPRWMDGPVYV